MIQLIEGNENEFTLLIDNKLLEIKKYEYGWSYVNGLSEIFFEDLNQLMENEF